MKAERGGGCSLGIGSSPGAARNRDAGKPDAPATQRRFWLLCASHEQEFSVVLLHLPINERPNRWSMHNNDNQD